MRTSTYLAGVVLAGTFTLLGPALTNAAALPAVIVERGFNGMGFASIILAVLQYLKGNNAYVSHQRVSLIHINETIATECLFL